ncbi:MAG: hypothetical protein AUH07_09760 [Gemmatimonadetes bacterium 13_2_20CM_70_9]|nr:MAG: hypothetical protein AUH07_09760 [Gemmatimonadetes bacterium 13_2_20CM_70_9]
MGLALQHRERFAVVAGRGETVRNRREQAQLCPHPREVLLAKTRWQLGRRAGVDHKYDKMGKRRGNAP